MEILTIDGGGQRCGGQHVETAPHWRESNGRVGGTGNLSHERQLIDQCGWSLFVVFRIVVFRTAKASEERKLDEILDHVLHADSAGDWIDVIFRRHIIPAGNWIPAIVVWQSNE